MKWLAPFKRYDLEHFDSVYVPLEQAGRQSNVFVNKRQASSNTLVSDSDVENGSTKRTEEPKTKTSLDSAGNTSDEDSTAISRALRSLRAEVEAEIAASGHDSAYDRKSTVVNKAIQEIGMGSYQWQLFTLCGFGWFADNLCE